MQIDFDDYQGKFLPREIRDSWHTVDDMVAFLAPYDVVDVDCNTYGISAIVTVASGHKISYNGYVMYDRALPKRRIR